jgi:cytochrome c-type protein NapB
MNVRLPALLASLTAALLAVTAPAQELPNGLRGKAPLDAEPKAPRMAREENYDVKRGRAYTSQPPTIPHSIEKYEITRNVNMCMYCHTRVRNEEFGAPMVSATHYMDREYEFLAEISPRRYFCTQCHVPQTDARPPVGNTFVDVYDIIERERAEAVKSDKSKPGQDKPAQ